jgi:hypothetical protein
MKTEPLRTLVAAYGLATLAGLAAVGLGVNPWFALLSAWIGGAIAALVIAALKLPRSGSAVMAATDADLSTEQQRWEEDRRSDRAAAAADAAVRWRA